MDETNKHIVGYGDVQAASESIHNSLMPSDCLKVSIKNVKDRNANLPHPIPGGDMFTVGDAKGSFVAWPRSRMQLKKKSNKPSM